jgi:hypothetical protein
MTPGARSSEFWMSVVAFLWGGALAAVGILWGWEVLLVSGVALQALVAVGYQHSRGRSKAPRPFLPPSGRA